MVSWSCECDRRPAGLPSIARQGSSIGAERNSQPLSTWPTTARLKSKAKRSADILCLAGARLAMHDRGDRLNTSRVIASNDTVWGRIEGRPDFVARPVGPPRYRFGVFAASGWTSVVRRQSTSSTTWIQRQLWSCGRRPRIARRLRQWLR